jgi:hypothetical protein
MQGPGGVAAIERRDLVKRPGSAVAHNLPAAVSSFLGRDTELA